MKTIYKNALLLIFLILPSLTLQKLKSFQQSNSFLQLTQQEEKEELTDEEKEENIILEIKDSANIHFATGKCDLSNCDNCVSSNICQCPNGYAHDPKKEVQKDVKSCQYKLKKQTIFFLLEMLLPFGVGHLYAGRILYGVLKMLVCALIITIDIVVKRILKSFDSKQKFNIFMYAFYFGYIAWIVIDLICIGINHFKDGKDFEILTMKDDI